MIFRHSSCFVSCAAKL